MPLDAAPSDALRALQPPPEAGEAAYLPAFRAVADLVLNQLDWHIGGRRHRIVEVELYWNGPAHPDTFAHGDPFQHEVGRWYFHRSGGEYRGGTYKGLDIAFGREGAPAGILIRGAAALGGGGALLDGPCLCVDHLLELTGHPSIQSLVAAFDRSVDPAFDSPLFLAPAHEPRADPVYEGPRVGLTLKRGVLADRARFLARPYRFLTEPARIKKGRPHLVIGMHRQGQGLDDIAARTGSSAAQVRKILGLYEAGRDLDPADLAKDLGSDDTCRLIGACDAADARACESA